MRSIQSGNLHTSRLYGAYGWLLLSGTLHFAIDVVGQYCLRSHRGSSSLYSLAWADSGLSGCFVLAGDMCPIPGVPAAPHDRCTVRSPSRCSGPYLMSTTNQLASNRLYKGTIMKLTGRTILITGGTSGIGLELAKQLIAQRNTVLITGRDAERLAATRSTLPVHTYLCDAGNPADIQKLQKTIAADFPKLDTLINNAGIMRNLDLNQPHELTDVTLELAVNLCGPVQMVQAFLPGLVPFPLSPVYSAAKAGVHAYTRCLRAQLTQSNVRIVEVAPPGTETPLFRGEFEKEMKGQKGMDVQALAKKTILGIESGKTEIRPGLSNILYVLSRIAPRIPFGQMAKMLPAAAVTAPPFERQAFRKRRRPRSPATLSDGRHLPASITAHPPESAV